MRVAVVCGTYDTKLMYEYKYTLYSSTSVKLCFFFPQEEHRAWPLINVYPCKSSTCWEVLSAIKPVNI